MHPIHDIDVLFLLATALAAKRRPAEAVEIVAAIDLIHGNVPSEEKLAEAGRRLGESGLLTGSADGMALSAPAEAMVEALPRKGDHPARLAALRVLLADYTPIAASAIECPAEQWRTAILAHRAAAASTAKNLLVPKPKPEAAQARPGQRQRKPMPKSKSRKR
jgi:hypothetical protein